ncbi:Nitrogen regulation protein NIFR3 [Staphylococcus aureus subsp. aureus 71193]|nr:Nitrogen regulation protein NIFR3 [Staphylococcus aureus subsp. aureus 71193]
MGPNKEKLDSQFLQTMQVGVGRRNKFCENIISVPLPPQTTSYKA